MALAETALPLGPTASMIGRNASSRSPPAARGRHGHSATSHSRGTTLQDLVVMKLSQDERTMYPAHGFAKGGIGNLLSTGARGGLQHLPHGHKPGTWRNSTTRALSAGSVRNSCSSQTWTQCDTSPQVSHLSATFISHGTVGRGSGPLGASQQAMTSSSTTHRHSTPSAKEWERAVQHPHDFQAASRRLRTHDVPHASRWAGLSMYENDPAEICRHLDIVHSLEQSHRQAKVQEQLEQQERHSGWTQQQRSQFRRQRLELALRYEATGLPPRPSYAWALQGPLQPTTPTAAAVTVKGPSSTGVVDDGSHSTGSVCGHSTYSVDPAASVTGSSKQPGSARLSDTSGQGSAAGQQSGAPKGVLQRLQRGIGNTRPASAPATHSWPQRVPLPPPTFVKVYDKMTHESQESPRQRAEQWRNKQQAVKQQQEAATVTAQVAELDVFDMHLESLASQQQRAAQGTAQHVAW